MQKISMRVCANIVPLVVQNGNSRMRVCLPFTPAGSPPHASGPAAERGAACRTGKWNANELFLESCARSVIPYAHSSKVEDPAASVWKFHETRHPPTR